MSLNYGFSTASDLLKKLERDAKSLDDEVTSDRMFNFVVTGYSLIDWIKKDPNVPQAAKTKNEIEALYSDKWLKVCGDLATASKHFTITKRPSITTSATSSQGFGEGRYGKGDFGVGEEAIEIELNDGTKHDALMLVNGVLNKWRSFFQTHGIQRQQRK
jgi:hypothetical protein